MAPTAKLTTKPIITLSMNTNFGLDPKSNISQNLAYVDIANLPNELDSAINSNGQKINILVTFSIIAKY